MWGKGKQKPSREFLTKSLNNFINIASDLFNYSTTINTPPSLDHLADILSEDYLVKEVQEQLDVTSLIAASADAAAKAHSQAVEKQLAELRLLVQSTCAQAQPAPHPSIRSYPTDPAPAEVQHGLPYSPM